MSKADPTWGGAREGAGRKPTYPESSRSQVFCLPERLIDKLARLAKREGETVNRYLAQTIEGLK
ncbi:hypothetical protein LCGC14_0323170 [marine sediment metagenome]|uniref:Arc-like DNA binding domain-containing protein n=1 Tax=marine sediment metagenome TaxID=412755 RepID=A0A0F9WQS7_9ZZZZ